MECMQDEIKELEKRKQRLEYALYKLSLYKDALAELMGIIAARELFVCMVSELENINKVLEGCKEK